MYATNTCVPHVFHILTLNLSSADESVCSQPKFDTIHI